MINQLLGAISQMQNMLALQTLLGPMPQGMPQGPGAGQGASASETRQSRHSDDYHSGHHYGSGDRSSQPNSGNPTCIKFFVGGISYSAKGKQSIHTATLLSNFYIN